MKKPSSLHTKQNCELSLPVAETLISIITIVYNGEKHLEQTIQSVLNQTYPNIEYIIVDGGSTDSTLEIIKRYSDRITKWVSEPDEGIADAMNSGIEMASGDYLLFLHADDYLFSDTVIENFVHQYQPSNFDIYAFSVLYGDQPDNQKPIKSRGLNFWKNLKTGIMHQATFCKRKLFDQIGGFDLGNCQHSCAV